METNFKKFVEGTAAFQRMWVETASRLSQAAFTVQPGSTPPDSLRQVRTGIFQALSESWDAFMRSEQFQEGMRQWMDQTVRWRKASNDVMVRVRKEMQAPSREDIDSIMLTVRHMEQRLLTRLDELSARIDSGRGSSSPAAPRKQPARKAGKTRVPANGKGAGI